MSWSQNPQHDPQNSSGPSASDSSSIAANSNLQSLYYLLINNGKLQDLVNQQQMLDTDGVWLLICINFMHFHLNAIPIFVCGISI